LANTKERQKSKTLRDRERDTEWIKDAVKTTDDDTVVVDYCSMDGPEALPDAYAGGSDKVVSSEEVRRKAFQSDTKPAATKPAEPPKS